MGSGLSEFVLQIQIAIRQGDGNKQGLNYNCLLQIYKNNLHMEEDGSGICLWFSFGAFLEPKPKRIKPNQTKPNHTLKPSYLRAMEKSLFAVGIGFLDSCTAGTVWYILNKHFIVFIDEQFVQCAICEKEACTY